MIEMKKVKKLIFPSSRNSFLNAFGAPKDVKIDQKLSLDDDKNE